MSSQNQNDLEEFVIGASLYYIILAVIFTYPAFTIAYILGCIFGIDTGVVAWMLGTLTLGIMLHLQMIRTLVWIAVLTVIPFIFIIKLIFS